MKLYAHSAGSSVLPLDPMPSGADPFLTEDALQECQLLSIYHDALHHRVGLLLDLRTWEWPQLGETGVFVVHGTVDVAWEAAARSTPRTAWTLLSSTISLAEDLLTLTCGFFPDAGLKVAGASAVFSTGWIADLPRDVAPPDYSSSEAEVNAGIGHWWSEFEPVAQASSPSTLGTRRSPRPSPFAP